MPACHACMAESVPCVSQALAWAVECSEVGGAAAVARLTGGSSGSRGGATAPAQGAATREQEARRREREAGRREQEAQQSALVEESTRVLRLFASNAGVAHDRVRGIQRVQNLQLYSDYTRCALGMAATELPSQLVPTEPAGAMDTCTHAASTPGCAPHLSCRRRARIRLETSPVGAPLNERQLFHGADKVGSCLPWAGNPSACCSRRDAGCAAQECAKSAAEWGTEHAAAPLTTCPAAPPAGHAVAHC